MLFGEARYGLAVTLGSLRSQSKALTKKYYLIYSKSLSPKVVIPSACLSGAFTRLQSERTRAVLGVLKSDLMQK